MPTIQTREIVIVGNGQILPGDFRMGPNEQNQHFAELRQKVCLYTDATVLPRDLASLETKKKLFMRKKRKKRLANLSQPDYMGTSWAKCTFYGIEAKLCLYMYTHYLVPLRGLPSLEGKHELFVRKKRKKRSAKLGSDRL